MVATPTLTALYVPGDRPDRFAKAAASGADAVIIDLEDAVASVDKETPRRQVVDYLSAGTPVPTMVRINSADIPWQPGDLDALRAATHLAGLWVPKAGDVADLAPVRDALGEVPVHAIVETARGVQHLAAIAGHPSVTSVGLGEADLRSEMRITDPNGLGWVRSALVVAAAASGLTPPMMSVWTDLDNLAGLAADCRTGRANGFLGRTAIHPRQVPVIREAFLPTAGEVAHDREVLDPLQVAGGGVWRCCLGNGWLMPP